MKNTALKNIKTGAMFALSLLLIGTVLFAYRNQYTYAYELTFLSNSLTGLFLLAAGIARLLRKDLPPFLFLDCSILLLIVFGVCMAFVSEFSFENGFQFLHIVNPLLVFLFYLFFTDQSAVRPLFLLTVSVLPAAYMIFALIFGAVTGNYIYFFLDYTTHGVGYTVGFLVGIFLGLTAVGAALFFLNRLIHRRILQNI